MTDNYTRQVPDQRGTGKTLEEDARGLLARAAKEGTPVSELTLRESGDGRTAMLEAVRSEAARLVGLSIIERSETEVDTDFPIEATTNELPEEISDEDPRLTLLKEQYEALPQADRTSVKGVMTWEQVVSAIPNMSEFLTGVDSLSVPEVYWVNEEGQLVVGDGCAESAQETRNLDYNQSRAAAMSVANRGLITLEEYKRKNRGQFEVQTYIWVESGENPSTARNACWYGGRVRSDERNPGNGYLGSRRVLRVNLNLEA